MTLFSLLRWKVRGGLCCVLMFFPVLVSAHASPVSYEPEASSIQEMAPQGVRIRFSERIEPEASRITVYDPSGKEIETGRANVDTTDAHIFSFPLHVSTTGTYTVAWQVVSADDGHFTKGAYVFSVGGESLLAINTSQYQVNVIHSSPWLEAFMIWAELLGQALLFATLILTFVLWPLLENSVRREEEQRVHRRFTWMIIAGIFLIALGTIGYVLFKSNTLAGNLDVTFAQALRSFVKTVAGRYTLYRLVGALLFGALFFVRPQSLQGNLYSYRNFILLCLVALMAHMRAQVSHAAASEVLPGISIFVNFIHILFKELWIGGLVVYVTLFIPLLDSIQHVQNKVKTMLTFSRILMIAFLGGGITGVFVTWLHLKDPYNIPLTHWGMYFLSLMTFAVIFLLLRLFQQLLIEPALVRGDKASEEDHELTRAMGTVLFIEMWVGLGVLFLSSVLLMTTPPLGQWNFWQQRTENQGVTVTLEEDPYDMSTFLLTFAESAVPIDEPVVTLSNREKGIGPIVAKTTKSFENGFALSKSQLSPPGDWKIDVTGKRSSRYDVVGSFDVSYPQAIDAEHQKKVVFNAFAFVHIGLAFLLLVIFVLLWRENGRLLRMLGQSSASDQEFPSLRVPRPAFVALLSVSALLALGAMGHAHGNAFQKLCELEGGEWGEDVPMQRGRVTSPIPLMGCTVRTERGQYHFADARAFSFFVQEIAEQVDDEASGITR